MKNNIIISLLSLCALLAFPGCEKNATDELLPGANLSFRLRVEGPAMTKTTGTDYIDDLETESEISSLDICLIKKDGLNDDSPVIIINNSTNPRELAWKPLTEGANEYEVNVIVPNTITDDYLLYVIANRPSWMIIEKYSDICGTFTKSAEDLADCWADNNFLMINVQDAVTTSGDQAGVAVTMAPDKTDSKVEKTVTIERLATKIRVKKNLSMEVAPLLTQVLCSGDNVGDPDIKGAIAAMTLEGYALFNCVNSFNLIQRWSAATGSGSQPKLLVSPSSDATTPYDMSTGYYNNTKSDFDPVNDTENPGKTKPSPKFKDLGTVFYCMENNSPYYDTPLVSERGDATVGTKMKGRVTGLIFLARAGYAKSFSGEAIVTEPLYVDDNTIGWTTKDGEPNSTNDDIFWTTLYQYKGDYYGDIPCLLKNNYAALVDGKGLSSSSTPNELRNAGVKVFEDGYMYYNYWITDPNYTDNGKNYLSVMRNTFYDINITAINSLGDEFPCGGSSYNSSDPISVDVPKLTIWMDIPDWTDKTGNYVIQ